MERAAKINILKSRKGIGEPSNWPSDRRRFCGAQGFSPSAKTSAQAELISSKHFKPKDGNRLWRLEPKTKGNCESSCLLFWSEWSDSNARPREPKSRALPTALHPDIQFFCMIPCGEGKSKFFVSVGGAVVRPNFAGVFQPGNFRRKLLSQGLPGSRFQGNGWVVYPPKAGALPTALHPDNLIFL